MIQRSKALLSGDPQTKERVERYERVFLNKNPSFYDRQYVRFYRGFLAEKSKVGIAAAAAVKGVNPIIRKKGYNRKSRIGLLIMPLPAKRDKKALKTIHFMSPIAFTGKIFFQNWIKQKIPQETRLTQSLRNMTISGVF